MPLLVSVIVPVFNVRPYLQEALDSVVQQTYGNLEILVVDDGSDDGSEGICDAYAKYPRVQVIHQKNRGLSAARNSGLDRMSGDVVAFLDADDFYYPDMIQTLLAAMQRNNADIVVGGYDRCVSGTRMGKRRNEKVFAFQKEEVLCSSEALVAMVEDRLNKSVWNKLYVRKLWNTLRFPEGRVFEDIFTTYQLLGGAERIVTIPGTQMMHRIRDGSITQNRSAQNLRNRLAAYDHLEHFVSRHIPGLFNDRHLRRLQTRHTRMLLANWNRLSWLEKAGAWDVGKAILDKTKVLEREEMDGRALQTLLSSLEKCFPQFLSPEGDEQACARVRRTDASVRNYNKPRRDAGGEGDGKHGEHTGIHL